MDFISVELSDIRAELRRVADLSPLMVWITDALGNCIYLNARWYDFTGQTSEQGMGFGWANALHHDDQSKAIDQFSCAAKANLPYHLEYRLCRSDGGFEWVVDVGHPYLGPDASLGGYIGSVSTIGAARVPVSDRKLLTPRETEVVSWIAKGKTSIEIAQILGIAPRTVEQHAVASMTKLGATNRVQMAVEALRLGEIAI